MILSMHYLLIFHPILILLLWLSSVLMKRRVLPSSLMLSNLLLFLRKFKLFRIVCNFLMSFFKLISWILWAWILLILGWRKKGSTLFFSPSKDILIYSNDLSPCCTCSLDNNFIPSSNQSRNHYYGKMSHKKSSS